MWEDTEINTYVRRQNWQKLTCLAANDLSDRKTQLPSFQLVLFWALQGGAEIIKVNICIYTYLSDLRLQYLGFSNQTSLQTKLFIQQKRMPLPPVVITDTLEKSTESNFLSWFCLRQYRQKHSLSLLCIIFLSVEWTLVTQP